MSYWAAATVFSPSESKVMRPKNRVTARIATIPIAASVKGSSQPACSRVKICLSSSLTSCGTNPLIAEVRSMQATASSNRPHWPLT